MWAQAGESRDMGGRDDRSTAPRRQTVAAVSAEQREEVNKRTAGLFMRLLTESCRQEAINVIKYEGLVAF
nr:hypothetical protein [Gammaproteobacteria bacterium]